TVSRSGGQHNRVVRSPPLVILSVRCFPRPRSRRRTAGGRAMFLKSIKRTVRAYLNRRGLDLVPAKNALSLDSALARPRALAVETVIDVGASDGRWSARVMKHYPA